MKSSNDYVNQALENISEDREKLVSLFEDIKRVGDTDPLALAAVSDNLVKIVDSLTKQTGQVVELAKLKQKTESKKVDDTDFDPNDHKNIYDEIESTTTVVDDTEVSYS